MIKKIVGKNYVLITPVKNEENTIKKVIDSVSDQTLRPFAWIIVNDGSNDSTGAILEKECKDIDWIYVLNKTVNKEYSWLGIANVLDAAFNYLKTLMKSGDLVGDFNYLGVLDADITIEKKYFEKLIKELNSDKKVGSISGNVLIKKGNTWYPENKGKSPRGGARLYRYSAFKESGGFPKTPSWESVSDVKLKIRGYTTKRLSHSKAYQHRETFSKDSKLRGMFLTGRVRYILHFTLLYTFLGSIYAGLVTKPYIFTGIAMFLGYITGFFTKTERIYDDEFVNYKKDLRKLFSD